MYNIDLTIYCTLYNAYQFNISIYISIINIRFYKILNFYKIILFSIVTLIMLLYICFSTGDMDSVNKYYDIQCFPSHLGEKPFCCIVSTVSYILVKTNECKNLLSYLGEKPGHCIVSMVPHILGKTYQCRNINNKCDKLYQCIYDETYFIQNIVFLKCSCKHTGERTFILFGLLTIYKRGILGRNKMHSKPCHNRIRYAFNISNIHILLHTDLMLDLVYILYRIGRSIFITLLPHVR